MKNFIKDIMVSIIIGFITFYLIYVINGSVLYNDLYAQGLPFLEYFKNQFSILDGGLGYNWNMGLGDSSYSFIIYYLLSPFNLLLLPFKSVNMVTILPIFMTIKISFIVYFASLYFKRVVSHEYRWIGALIYLGSYNILMYGSIHVMWLDTFAFLPLVLLAIEKVINKEGYTAYVIALFLLIVTNYYLAALLIIHIAIYGITRYVVINGRVGMLRFILKTIGYSVIAGLLASFVFVPAIGYMLSSSKDISSINLLTNSLSRLFNVISSNYIGSQYSYSGTYITLIGLISIIPIILFTNVKGRYLYLVPIVLILLAVFSDHINMMFNLGYEACGGNYRYNILLNIYVGIIACSGLKSISSGNRRVCFTVCLVSILSICIFKNQPSVNTQVLYLNIGFVICYTV
ncbi:MAG: YfhO family protein, partial [Clostridium sp.]